jgi:F-type H+-transporting ATPase subunit epsilon
MKVDIITPDSTLFSGDQVELVQLPGIDGSFEILNDHAPLISILKQGRIKLQNKGEREQYFEIRGGVIEVISNKILILAE